MKVLIGQRGSGTTTDLLLEASKFKDNALFISMYSKWTVEAKCRALGIDSPTVIDWADVIHGNFDQTKNYRIFIDNVDALICNVLRNNKVRGNLETVSFSMEQMHRKSYFLDWDRIEPGQAVVTNTGSIGVVLSKNSEEFRYQELDGNIYIIERGVNYWALGLRKVGCQEIEP